MKNQCKALTLQGLPCKTSCYKDNEFCHQHNKIYYICSICLDNKYMNTKNILCCGHEFCNLCINTWELSGNYNCPCCRRPFFSNKIKVKNKLMELVHKIPYEDNNKTKIEIINEIFDILNLPIAEVFIQHPLLNSLLKNKVLEFEKILGSEHKCIIKWKNIIDSN